MDDKTNHATGCGFAFMKDLSLQLSKYIHFVSNPNDIADFQGETCVLKIEISDYIFFLFHDSFNDGLFSGTERDLLSEKFGKNMIGFSGEGFIEVKENVTSRELVFSRLRDILTAYHYTGHMDFKTFFNSKTKLQNKLLDDMIEILIEQEKSALIDSKELKIWSQIKGSDLDIMKSNLSVLTEEDIMDRIENNWRTQDIIWSI